VGATSYSPLSRRAAFVSAAVIAIMLAGQCGCVATKYKLARKNTPPVQPLNVAFPSTPPLRTTLTALISNGGPGSWKREALWDEYVVTIENYGERPLTISSTMLVGASGTPHAAGSNPWALEKQSKRLEKEYRDRGEAFLRAAGPGAMIVGVGAATGAAAAGAGAAYVSPAAAGAAAATIIVLPVYYATVLGINHHNKKAVTTEFNRRRLPLPLTLAAGETRTGSLFYPTVRSPGSLALAWSNDTSSSTAAISLEFLQALHVPVATKDHDSKQISTK
jgi:hypothetical protein